MLKEDLVADFQHLKGAYKKGGDRFLCRVYSDRTKGNDFKPKKGRFRLDAMKKFLQQG